MAATNKLGAVLWALCVALPAGAADQERGRELFRPCIACHGETAAGNDAIRAPAIAGLPEWYIARQLQNFRNGRRGSNDADPYGVQMARMAQQLWDEGEVRSVASYVASLPTAPGASTSRGRAKRGEAAFASCAACHGADAAGNPELGAPPLRSLDDWYLVDQVNAFRAGLRGMHPDDAAGLSMRVAAEAVTDEAVALDIAAFVATLDGAAEIARHRE